MYGKKEGILGVLAALFVAIFMTTTVTATGYFDQNVMFAEDFDGLTDVDYEEFTVYNESAATISYDAMSCNFDTFNVDDTGNWSYGIYATEGFDNSTIYSEKDVYMQWYMGETGIYTGLVDTYYVNDTDMSGDYAGMVGVLFYLGQSEGIDVWWVDSTHTMQFYTLDLDIFEERWYEVKMVYEDANHTANVNVTDSVTGASDNYDATHIKAALDDVVDYTMPYIAGQPAMFKGNQIYVSHNFDSVALIDNIIDYTYDWVTIPVPQPVPPTPDFTQLFGFWIAVTGAIIAVVGIAFYGNLSDYMNKQLGYLDHQYWAAIPAVVGGVITAVGAAFYYGYIPYDITYHPSWAWW